MQKLQDAILGASGEGAGFNSQQPPPTFLARDRSFRERADKIEALKQARTSAERAAQLPSLLFEIVRYRGHWRTLHNDKHSTLVRLIRHDGKVVVQSLDGEQDG